MFDWTDITSGGLKVLKRCLPKNQQVGVDAVMAALYMSLAGALALAVGVIQLWSHWIGLGTLANIAYVSTCFVLGIGLLVASVAILIAARHADETNVSFVPPTSDQDGNEDRCLACGAEFPSSSDKCSKCGWSFG